MKDSCSNCVHSIKEDYLISTQNGPATAFICNKVVSNLQGVILLPDDINASNIIENKIKIYVDWEFICKFYKSVNK